MAPSREPGPDPEDRSPGIREGPHAPPGPPQVLGLRAEGHPALPGAVRLPLKPLTVMFGAPGAGPPALGRLLLGLAAGLRGGGPPAAGPAEGAGGAGLPDLGLGGATGPVALGLDLRAPGGPRRSVDFTLDRPPGSPPAPAPPALQAWALSGDGAPLRLWRPAPGAPWVGEGAPPPDAFDGLRPRWEPGGPDLSPLRPPRAVHLGPARGLGPAALPGGPAPVLHDLGAGGEGTAAALAALGWAGDLAARDAIFAQARRLLGMELRLGEPPEGPSPGTPLLGRAGSGGAWLPASHLGAGLQHALPVLVQLALLGRDGAAPTFAFLEAPEAHLPPAAQAALADALIAPVRAGRAQLLIDAHAEALVLRLLRRVAEGALSADLLQLWFFEDPVTGAGPRALEVDADGELRPWPEGWFDVALLEAQARRRAARASSW